MLKTVTGLLAALFVAGFPLAYGQEYSSPMPRQQAPTPSPTDFKVLTDARIGIVKAALQLTPEQEKLWPPVEEAIRARADARYQRIAKVAQRQSQQGEVDPIALLRDRSDALAAKAAALKKLADAWAPLHQSLSPDQKQRMRLLAMRVLHIREGVDPQPMAMYDERDDCD
jgi:hypothetical protein